MNDELSIASAEADLAGRSILLTGGSSGIGRAILDAILETEAEVAVISRRDPVAWPGGAPSRTARLCHIAADLADRNTVQDGIRQASQAFRVPFDTIIQCAATYGGSSRHPFYEIGHEEWDEAISVNVSGQFHVLKAVYPDLLKLPRALIIHITSDVATRPGPGRVAYASSKAAAHALHAGLAEEGANSGLSVVQLLPLRQVKTPGLERRRPPGFDFAGYLLPEAFSDPAMQLVRTFGAGMNGCCIGV